MADSSRPPPDRERDYDRNDEAGASGRGAAADSRRKPAPAQPKQNANYETSGLLAKETNTFNGVVLKWNEPADAKVPTEKWRLYVFKDDKPLDEPFHVHRQSAYLLGRERRVADIPLDHPSCSSQHAVLQFRLTEKAEDGVKRRRVRPYLMDLNSTNGSYLNGEQIEPQRYVELFEQDVLKFAYSAREYVLLHDKSADD